MELDKVKDRKNELMKCAVVACSKKYGINKITAIVIDHEATQVNE